MKVSPPFLLNNWFLKAVNNLLLFAFLAAQLGTVSVAATASKQDQTLNQTKNQPQSQPEWRYSVRPGDNLIQFSNRYLLNPDDWRTLQNLNRIKNPYRMPIGSVLRVPLILMKQVPTSAEVALATGKVGILKADNSVQVLAIGQQLGAGTVLVTGYNSKLNIKLADGSIVSMQPTPP